DDPLKNGQALELLHNLVAERSGTWTPDQRVLQVGLIGSGIQLSRTPFMHEREAAALGCRLDYHLIDLRRFGVGVESLSALIGAAQELGFAGLNITHPCKQAALQAVDKLAEDAAAIGALNTIVFRDGMRYGFNTDCSGFAESFQQGLPDVKKERVLLLGAGGAGAAVAHALLRIGVDELLIHDVDPDRARTLVTQIISQFGSGRAQVSAQPEQELATANGLVNATPIGMESYPGVPLDTTYLQDSHWLADIIYFPIETELLKQARAQGCQVLTGEGMAIYQAVHAFRLFTGKEPQPERMKQFFNLAASR
ncbi:shikimate dehydrogenase, partial [Sedimenticola sp.]|uniref:shikimate dehydrogenase n=1 Tax=Sedimenticola sp. TaxID=1940285 RepID=UPI003D0F3F69